MRPQNWAGSLAMITDMLRVMLARRIPTCHERQRE
jgi:hypothetical protein